MCNNRCSGCAFTKGSEANLESRNHLRALICLLGPIPFQCHDNIDYKNVNQADKISKQEYKEIGFKICQGWRESVAELNKTGYYKHNPMITKALSIVGLENLELFLYCCENDENQEDKIESLKILQNCVNSLGKKWSKFKNKKGE